MGDKIAINSEVFTSETSKMQASANNVKFNFTATLSETNVEPFTGYLELIEELKSSVEEFKSLVLQDISNINSIGEGIKEADKTVARSISSAQAGLSSGPIPM